MENKNIQKTTAEESSDIFAVAEDQDKKTPQSTMRHL